jgi:acyl-CoA dehydrogenase
VKALVKSKTEQYESQILKQNAVSFVRKYILPQEQKQIPFESISYLQEKAKEMGYWSLGSKKEWGGAELSLADRVSILEKAVQHRWGFQLPALGAFGADLPRFLETCTDQQINQYVLPAVKSGKGCFLAIWEQHEDTTLDYLNCQAVEKGNTWIINGEKHYIENPYQTDFGIVLVNCIVKGEKKPTLFIIESSDSITKKENRLLDVENTFSLYFSNVALSKDRIIGKVGQGMALLREWLIESQILLAAKCLGIAQQAIQISIEYASYRKTRGKSLSEFPTIKTMLARSHMEICSARLLVQEAATKFDNQTEDLEQYANMAKIMATEVSSKAVDNALQIHGGAGYAGDLPIQHWFKEMRIARIKQGRTEQLLMNIADSLMGSQQ